MVKIKSFAILILVFLCIFKVEAQRKKKNRIEIEQSPRQELVYDDYIYLPSIQSVQAFPIGKEGKMPIYTLGTNEELQVSFDDLRADGRSFYYNIEHCNADWTASRVSVLDYAEGYNEDRIVEVNQSIGTIQGYSHYEFTFPNEYVKPKIAGNYLLKVYEDADKERLIITRKIYVVRPLINVESQIIASTFADKRLTNQKLNITLKTGLSISNPHRDLKVIVLQNQRSDNAMVLSSPTFMGPTEIKFNHTETLDFKANNEFRYVDLRSFKGGSAQTDKIIADSAFNIFLFPDEDKRESTYATLYDENGRFYIRNLDYEQPEISGDYAYVHFSLNSNQEVKGDIFVVGGFNNFQRTEANKLKYNSATKRWEVTLKLKQGLYDYEYVLVTPDKKIVTDAFSSSFYDTGNDYTVLVYFRRTGTYWDEILGLGNISINNKENKN